MDVIYIGIGMVFFLACSGLVRLISYLQGDK
jgi:hypothetical protein